MDRSIKMIQAECQIFVFGSDILSIIKEFHKEVVKARGGEYTWFKNKHRSAWSKNPFKFRKVEEDMIVWNMVQHRAD